MAKKSKAVSRFARSKLSPLVAARLEEVTGGYYTLMEWLRGDEDRRYTIIIWGYFEAPLTFGRTADDAALKALETGKPGPWPREM